MRCVRCLGTGLDPAGHYETRRAGAPPIDPPPALPPDVPRCRCGPLPGPPPPTPTQPFLDGGMGCSVLILLLAAGAGLGVVTLAKWAAHLLA